MCQTGSRCSNANSRLHKFSRVTFGLGGFAVARPALLVARAAAAGGAMASHDCAPLLSAGCLAAGRQTANTAADDGRRVRLTPPAFAAHDAAAACMDSGDGACYEHRYRAVAHSC